MEYLEEVKIGLDNYNNMRLWGKCYYWNHREEIMNKIKELYDMINYISKQNNNYNGNRTLIKRDEKIITQYKELLKTYQIFFELYFYDGAEKFYL